LDDEDDWLALGAAALSVGRDGSRARVRSLGGAAARGPPFFCALALPPLDLARRDLAVSNCECHEQHGRRVPGARTRDVVVVGRLLTRSRSSFSLHRLLSLSLKR
jgi:hypothetical protein